MYISVDMLCMYALAFDSSLCSVCMIIHCKCFACIHICLFICVCIYVVLLYATLVIFLLMFCIVNWYCNTFTHGSDSGVLSGADINIRDSVDSGTAVVTSLLFYVFCPYITSYHLFACACATPFCNNCIWISVTGVRPLCSLIYPKT